MKFRGEVIHGRNLGHTLGFPTANIKIDPLVDIENGVYFSKVVIDNVEYRAVSNIGTKPTVGGDERSLECYILDFHADIYGREIEVETISKLRDEQHFESIVALQNAIAKDVERVKNLK